MVTVGGGGFTVYSAEGRLVVVFKNVPFQPFFALKSVSVGILGHRGSSQGSFPQVPCPRSGTCWLPQKQCRPRERALCVRLGAHLQVKSLDSYLKYFLFCFSQVTPAMCFKAVMTWLFQLRGTSAEGTSF